MDGKTGVLVKHKTEIEKEIGSLQNRIDQTRENLSLVQEKLSQFIPSERPLTQVQNEKRLQSELDNLISELRQKQYDYTIIYKQLEQNSSDFSRKGVPSFTPLVTDGKTSDELAKNDKSWWSTLPGILTGIAAIITALGGFIAILSTSGILHLSTSPSLVEQPTTVTATELVSTLTPLPIRTLISTQETPGACRNVTEIPMAECQALIVLYNNTNGFNWLNDEGWLKTNQPCSWYGVTCDQFHVLKVELPKNQLKGIIPAELTKLTHLVKLDLGHNELSGIIPQALGNLATLEELSLYENQLTGSIPSMLGDVTELKVLALQANQLSGMIPPEIGKLTHLEWLYLHDNRLSGTIPLELTMLVKLKYINLGMNKELVGGIPPEIGGMANLEDLHLYATKLGGNIPPQLGRLVSLRQLDLSASSLNGNIPQSLGNLKNLSVLRLNDNQLNGSLPRELDNLVNLSVLRLDHNHLSGSIPPTYIQLTTLVELDLGHNALIVNDPKLAEFLKTKDPDWEESQTSLSKIDNALLMINLRSN